MKIKLIKFLCALAVCISVPGCLANTNNTASLTSHFAMFTAIGLAGLVGFIVCRFFE